MKEFPARLRQIPPVNALVEHIQTFLQPRVLNRAIAVETARAIANHLRQNPDAALNDGLISEFLDPLTDPGPKRVVNGTGILLHTNLGRTPLPIQAIERALGEAADFTALEFNLDTGKRGHRDHRFAALAKRLWPIEDATLVNNAAAAVTLALASLAQNRETVISRGELIEIGGSFRMPDIMKFAGTKLVEVGTTNKTRIEDYRNALGPETACLFKAHPSNFSIEGFTQQTPLKEMVALGREAGIPVIMDLGSGLSHLAQLTRSDESTIEDCLDCQADLVIFSGDKLFGGVQAGMVLGKAALIAKMRRHPMMRMVRVDKFTHGIVAQQLSQLAFGEPSRLTTLANQSKSDMENRARSLLNQLPTERFEMVASSAFLGGGSMPGQARPSVSLVFRAGKAQKIADKARTLTPPLIGHIQKDAFHINLAGIFPHQDDVLLQLLKTLNDQV